MSESFRQESESRARVLAEVLRSIAASPTVVTLQAIHQSCATVFAQPEEEIAQETERALFLLCRAGLIKSPQFDSYANVLSLSSSTEFVASPNLTAFIWHEDD